MRESQTSSPARKREEDERGKCTDSQRRRNTLDGKTSRRFQSKSSFSDDVVGFNSAFWHERTSGTVDYSMEVENFPFCEDSGTEYNTFREHPTKEDLTRSHSFAQYGRHWWATMSSSVFQAVHKLTFYLPVIDNPKFGTGSSGLASTAWSSK